MPPSEKREAGLARAPHVLPLAWVPIAASIEGPPICSVRDLIANGSRHGSQFNIDSRILKISTELAPISSAFLRNTVTFLCFPDCVAVGEGFEPSV